MHQQLMVQNVLGFKLCITTQSVYFCISYEYIKNNFIALTNEPAVPVTADINKCSESGYII